MCEINGVCVIFRMLLLVITNYGNYSNWSFVLRTLLVMFCQCLVIRTGSHPGNAVNTVR